MLMRKGMDIPVELLKWQLSFKNTALDMIMSLQNKSDCQMNIMGNFRAVSGLVSLAGL